MDRGATLAVVGQSHTLALLDGCEAMADRLPTGTEVSFVVDWRGTLVTATASDGRVRRQNTTVGIAPLLENLAATHVALLWWGNQVNLRALLQLGPPFDVVLGADGVPVDRGIEVIPCSVVDEYVRTSLEEDPMLPRALDAAASAGATLTFLAPPPPLPEAAVRARLATSPWFVDILAELRTSAADVDIVPDAVRARLRRLLLEAYRSFAVAHGAAFVAPPASVHDDAGMLREEYWADDVTHGNTAYGAVYLEHLLRHVTGDGHG